MKTLLVLLLVSGLVAESSAWPSWQAFTDSVKAKFEGAKDTWNDKVAPFFTGLAKKAKDFVTGKKGEFEKLSNSLKSKIDKLEDCNDCEYRKCSEDEYVECEELFINYEKVNNYMECMDGGNPNDCGLHLGKSAEVTATPPPKRELSARDERIVEERRAAVLLKALIKKGLN